MAIKPVSGEIKAQVLNDNFSALDSNLANLSIGPFDTYMSLSALQSAYPNGRNGFAVVLESDGKTGYMYTWTGTTWKKGGLAQAMGIANKSVSIEKTDFLNPDFTNIVTSASYVPDEYYSKDNGALIKKGDAGYSNGFGRTPLFQVEPGMTLYRNKFLGGSDLGGVFVSYFTNSDATGFVSGTVWYPSQNIEFSKLTVPVNVKYATIAVHNRNVSESILTAGEVPSYANKKQVLKTENFEYLPYTYDQARLVSVPYSDEVIKIDYEKRKVVIDGKEIFALWSANYKWITRVGEVIEFTFDEINEEIQEGNYAYAFVKRNSVLAEGKSSFIFVAASKFMDSAGPQKGNSREMLAKNYVFLGAFSTGNQMASFPGTPTKIITSRQVDANTKLISFLGDSITSFAGYVPEGNSTYYPNAVIADVNQTWWKILVDESEGKLELLVNNSWSGGRVTTTSGTPQSGVTRATKLHSDTDDPDIIVVYLGVNDFNNHIDFGVYDGKTEIPTDTLKFSEAYAMMLNNMTLRYPYAKIYTCTIPFNTRGPFPRQNNNGIFLLDFNKRIRELSATFGVEVIDLESLGLNLNNITQFTSDGLHPNPSGMKLLSEKVRGAIM